MAAKDAAVGALVARVTFLGGGTNKGDDVASDRLPLDAKSNLVCGAGVLSSSSSEKVSFSVWLLASRATCLWASCTSEGSRVVSVSLDVDDGASC